MPKALLMYTSASAALVLEAAALAELAAALSLDAALALEAAALALEAAALAELADALALDAAALDEALPPHAVSTKAKDIVMANAAIFPIVFTFSFLP